MPATLAIFRILSWLAFLGLYLLMVGQTGISELAAGAAAATVALSLVRMMRRKFKRPLLIKPEWFLLLWRIPIATLVETWQLTTALFQRLTGRETEGVFIEHRLTAPHDEHAPARRAYMTFGVCVTPNSYLVFYDHEKKTVLIRQLVGDKLSKVDRVFVELT